MSILIQQGDCLLKKCGNFPEFKKNHAEIPKKAKKLKTNLVLKGNTNSHALYGGAFQIFEHEGVRFVKVNMPTKLDHVKDHTTRKAVHAEHHAQMIEVGEYWLDGVMEYDHQKEEKRQVID
jgi:hypothetical protein